MKKLPWWFRAFVRVVGTLSPTAMARLAWRLFWDLRPAMPLAPAARDVQARAVRATVTVNGRQAIVYRWGTGAETVLLVHGWRGRGSQFAAIIAALESPDRTIVAFDAPGNGEAPGKRTDVFDYIAVIRLVAERSGGIDTIIAHSFGVLAAFAAIRAGVQPRRVVSIAGVASFTYVVRAFADAVGLPPRVVRRLRARIQRKLFDNDPLFWTTYVSELAPTDTTPLLVIHDGDDRAVEFAQSASIAEAQVGPLTELYTNGLGHTRVLADPPVVAAIVSFAESAARTR